MKIAAEAENDIDDKSQQHDFAAYAVTRTPAAKGRAIPPISLSTFI